MIGKLVTNQTSDLHGRIPLIQIGENTFPVPFSEVGVRNIPFGGAVEFSVNSDGVAHIDSPTPVRGCVREQEQR